MTTHLRTAALAALVLTSIAAPAGATEICAWLVETVDKEDFREFSLFLEADGEADIYYMMKGQGLTSEGMRSYSPGTATYSLHARTPARVFGFGGTLNPPGDIDIIAEIHAQPASVFQEEEPPLLATFTFKRHVAEDEKAVPKTFAERRCQTVTIPPPKPQS